MSDRKLAEKYAEAMAEAADLVATALLKKGFTPAQTVAIVAGCLGAPNVNVFQPMMGMLGAPTTLN